jgi:hydrogenase nickel incorporation protein HypB
MGSVPLEDKVLDGNARIAAELREKFRKHRVLVINLISSPGSGKSSLLEKALETFPAGSHIAVLTSDIRAENGARRLERFGYTVKQIATGGIHLDAALIGRHVADLDLDQLDLLIIENVGNSPGLSNCDLGEAAKIALLNVADGEGKSSKYSFAKSEVMVLTKTDLLPYVPFAAAEAIANARRVDPDTEVVNVTTLTGDGLSEFMRWLEQRRRAFQAELPESPTS